MQWNCACNTGAANAGIDFSGSLTSWRSDSDSCGWRCSDHMSEAGLKSFARSFDAFTIQKIPRFEKRRHLWIFAQLDQSRSCSSHKSIIHFTPLRGDSGTSRCYRALEFEEVRNLQALWCCFQIWNNLILKRAPGMQIRGLKFQSSISNSRELELTNLLGLVLGCIEAKICKEILVGKLSPRSTQCTPLHRFGIESRSRGIRLGEEIYENKHWENEKNGDSFTKYLFAKKCWRFLAETLRLKNGAKECVV